MIKFEEALSIVKSKITSLDTENIDFINSIGRVLAEDVFSDINMPPFNKSAMDGFACRKEDLNNILEILEDIPAGKIPTKQIEKNQCSRIMTGAMVPKGANTVIMVEHIEQVDSNHIKFTAEKTNTNICYTAEDIKENDIVLEKGTMIKPQHIAVLASVGKTNIEVYKQPKVAVISTGDELVEPEHKPGISQIRNSNGMQLVAQIQQMNCIPVYMGIADDTEKATFDIITKAFQENDVVLLTGGVSMGDYDFVPKVMKKTGVEIYFQEVAVQPGKPTTFGKNPDGKFIYGLPGNPVSSFTQFELLVKPLLYGMMGYDFKPLELKLPMGATYSRKKSKRKSFLPVTIKEGKVFPVEYHGSAHIHSYVNANGIIAIEIGENTIEEGQVIDVRQV